ARPWTPKSTQKTKAPAANMVSQYARNDLGKDKNPPGAKCRTPQVKLCSAFSESTVTPRTAQAAETFAKNRVRVFTGSGASTSTSRRLGNVASQLSTAKMPTASMVVQIIECSNRQKTARRRSGGRRALLKRMPPRPCAALYVNKNAAKRPSS